MKVGYLGIGVIQIPEAAQVFDDAFFAPHEAQCRRNHGQTLQRINERCGFDWMEAAAVLADEHYWVTDERIPTIIAAMREVTKKYHQWQKFGFIDGWNAQPDTEG